MDIADDNLHHSDHGGQQSEYRGESANEDDAVYDAHLYSGNF